MLMRRLLVMISLLALGLGGITTAVSHLQMAFAHETELCADGTMRRALIGADGEEIALHHDCPDCALAALDLVLAPEPAAKRAARRAAFAQKSKPRKGVATRPRGARDPPSF